MLNQGREEALSKARERRASSRPGMGASRKRGVRSRNRRGDAMGAKQGNGETLATKTSLHTSRRTEICNRERESAILSRPYSP